MEKKAHKLLEKYTLGQCTEDEIILLQQWYLQLPPETEAPSHDQIERAKFLAWNNLSVHKSAAVFSLPYRKIAVAASILICIAVGLYITVKDKAATKIASTLNNVRPGANKATLTLHNGTVIDLTAAHDGEIANQNGIVIRKAANGQLEYEIVPTAASDQTFGNNVISTPRGGQYKVILPDGTKVWLNAASSLKYPTSFAKNDRTVTLSGEAYFEVAKDKNRPFKVQTVQQLVEVLGTHFNINAYADEETIKTTLLEGSVDVSNASGRVHLYPGQQAQLKSTGSRFTVDNSIDLDKEVAWKNELFSFDNDDLKSIMRQISRWYDVDVVYEGKVSDEKFIGEIPRNSNLAEVFKILELNQVRIDAKGRVLTVSGARK